MKNIYLKKNNIKSYCINMVLLLLTWGGMLRRSFNADTLYHMVSADHDVLSRLECGRYLCGLVDFLLGKLDLSTTTHTGITVFAGLLLMAAAICVIQEMFRPFVKIGNPIEQAAYYAVTGLVFVNVLAAELMMFSEFTAYFGMAYLFAAAGAALFVQKKYGKALICIAVSCMFYQVGVVFCAILIFVYLFLDSKEHFNKKVLWNELLGIVMTFGMGLVNMMSTKILVYLGILGELGKQTGLRDIVWKCRRVLQISGSLLKNSMGLMPGIGIPFLFLGLVIGSVLIVYIRKRNWKSLLYYILLMTVMWGMIFAISFLDEDFYISPRMIFTFYLIQAAAAIIALSRLEGIRKVIVCYACILYLIIQMLCVHNIITNHFVSNTLDKLYAAMVYDRILEYEAETGIRVTGLAVDKDMNAPDSYEQVYYKAYQINERALGTVSYSLMEVVTGRKFERIEMDPDIYDAYFEGKDWNHFDASKQLIIQGDVAYWIIF